MPPVRPAAVDALLGVAVTSLLAIAVAAGVGGGGQPAGAYAFAVAFGALMLARRTFPVQVLLATAAGIIAYYAADLPPIGLAVPIAAALYSAAEAGRVRWAGGVAVAMLVVSVSARLLEGDDAAYVLGLETGSAAVLMLAVVALGDAARSRRSLRAELDLRARRAAQDRHREASRQVEAERVRIARELHDALGHTMSVITLQSAVAAEALAGGEPVDAAAAVDAVREASAGAMADLRATLGSLRGEPVTRQPLAGLADLGHLADTVTRSGLPVELRIADHTAPLPTIVDTTAYRIVQEALTNALRHAHATRVVVTVHDTGDELHIDVVDDGRGAASPELGQGLRGMTERTALLGGAVEVGDDEHGGFRVAARLPLTRTPA